MVLYRRQAVDIVSLLALCLGLYLLLLLLLLLLLFPVSFWFRTVIAVLQCTERQHLATQTGFAKCWLGSSP